MQKLSALTIVLAAILVWPSFIAIGQQPHDQESPRWFVLRDQESSRCHAEILIRVQGNYRHGRGLRAGGPYTSEKDARARIAALSKTGTCVTRE